MTDRELLYFDEIKEGRGSYFVEYQPPASKNPFATLNLVYPGVFELSAVEEAMHSELIHWLSRYPVPIMISAFDAAENIIRPHGDTDDAFLIGWYEPDTKNVVTSWKTTGLPPFLNDTENRPDWRTIYTDIPFRTDAEVKANALQGAQKTRKQNFALKVLFAIWVAVIPAAWAIIQYLGPEWLALVVLLYSLWQAWRAAQKLFWRGELSQKEKEKEEKERRTAHYFYHCEKNPEGFARLKVENFENEFKDRTLREAAEIAKKQSTET